MQTTIVKYFKQQYDVKLRYPKLPCAIAGSQARPDWLPVELCSVVADAGEEIQLIHIDPVH
jgi:eukaryotic translation initiation factor 2C